jgi:hypothetical protein
MYDTFIGSAGRAATGIEGSKPGRDMLPEEVKVHQPPSSKDNRTCK